MSAHHRAVWCVFLVLGALLWALCRREWTPHASLAFVALWVAWGACNIPFVQPRKK